MEEVKDSVNEIRVRFAPSPTGFLHVGGARTAIFNWLFTKKHKGKFLLRIEDTDPLRSKSELSKQIIRSLKWLGMNPDEPIVYQSDRIERYKEIVRELIKNKKAYYAFETTGELEAKRNNARERKVAYKYDRASLNLDESAVKKYLSEGREYVIRFFIEEGVTEFDDIIHGKTIFRNTEIDDFVILRSDGSPVYQIAVVVDDHDMGITHVIRGDDHLSNTPKQILLYKALGWDIPQFAHLPMILDDEKKKLSKRRNTVAVEQYKELGYLPEALFNFLTLLGFAPENKIEIISREELIKVFTFERVNKKSAVFDMKKLNWLNSEYIKKADEKIIAELVGNAYMRSLGSQNIPSQRYLIDVINLMKERVSTINDFIDIGKYFFISPEIYDKKGLSKYWNDETKSLMEEYLQSLISTTSLKHTEFNANDLEEHLRKFIEPKNVKAANIIHPLRLALTGLTISPGIFELMEVLGKETVVTRVKKFISR